MTVQIFYERYYKDYKDSVYFLIEILILQISTRY